MTATSRSAASTPREATPSRCPSRPGPIPIPAVYANGDGGNAGQILVQAAGDGESIASGGTGHVTVGTGGGIVARGGTGSVAAVDFEGVEDDNNGADFLAGRGGDGGNAQITGDGTVLANGSIDATGGNSVATLGATDDVDFFTAQLIAIGGTGGTVSFDGGGMDDPDSDETEPTNPVQVLADITSRGGMGQGFVVVEDPLDGDQDFELAWRAAWGARRRSAARAPSRWAPRARSSPST